MKPLTLVAGFLGSGKTTLLRRFLANAGGRKILFLVNEFARGEIDATLLADAGGLAKAVTGGSVFCECKADDFKTLLIEAAAMPDIDGVVVEASGMAEPRAMGRILADPRLKDGYRLASLVAVVDPLSFPKLRHTLPAIVGQVAEADVVIINKCDCVDRAAIDAVRGDLAAINQNARIIETIRCDTDLDPLVQSRRDGSGLNERLTTCADRSFASVLVGFDKPTPLADFAAALGDLSESVVRVKGWLDTPDMGRLYVECDGPGRPLSHAAAAAGPSRLAVIVAGDAVRAAVNRLGGMPGCRVKT